MIRALWWVVAAVGFVVHGYYKIAAGNGFAGGFLVVLGIVGLFLMVMDLRRGLWRREDEEAAE